MNPLRLPKPTEPIANRDGTVTKAWLDYLRGLAESGNISALQQAIDQINAAIADLQNSGGLPRDTKILGDASVSVEGILSNGVVVISLQNDEAIPDPASYYGTSKDGVKGWNGLVVDSLGDVDAPSPSDGDALVWSASEGKWIPAPVSFSFGNPLTDESGNILTDQDGNILTDGRLSIDWSDVDNKPNTDGIPEGATNLYYTSARAQSVADSRIADHVAQPDPHPQYQLESGLGSAAFQPSSAFATAAQGAKADTALQSVPDASAQPWTPYTVATLPSVTPAYRSIYVTDLTGNPGPCYSDGTNWRRYSDDSIAS